MDNSSTRCFNPRPRRTPRVPAKPTEDDRKQLEIRRAIEDKLDELKLKREMSHG